MAEQCLLIYRRGNWVTKVLNDCHMVIQLTECIVKITMCFVIFNLDIVSKISFTEPCLNSIDNALFSLSTFPLNL